MSDTLGPMATVVHDGFSITSNEGTAEEIKENLDSEPKPLDGEPEDPEEAEKKKRSKAASELGKAGGEAAAKAREKSDKEADKEAEKAAKEEPPAKPEKEKAGDPRLDARARVMEATRELAEERRARKDLEARMAKLEAERAAPAKTEAKPEAGTEKPVLDNYDTWEEYNEALIDWKADQKIQALRKQDEERATVAKRTQEASERGTTFKERMLKAEEADPTLRDRLDMTFLAELLPTWALPPGTPPTAATDLAQEIIGSEQAPALLLHLSEHPEERERLLKLPDSYAVARAVGALEAKLSTEPAKGPEGKEQPVSRAKPPVKPLSGGPPASEEDLDKDDVPFDEYVKKANARDARARRAH